jgi:hypothetical protein
MKHGVYARLLPLAVLGLGCGSKAPPVVAPAPSSTAEVAMGTPLGTADPAASASAAPAASAPAPASATPSAPDASISVLAKNQHASAALSADGAHVYWVEDVEGTVTRVAKRGGAVMMFYSSSTGGFASPSMIAIDDADVFWTEHVKQPNGAVVSGVMKLEKMGGKPTVVASGIRDEMRSLAVDAKGVYWIAGTAIMRAAKDGAGASPLALKLADPTSVAGDGKFVYWTQTGAAEKGKDGGAVMRQAATPGAKQEVLAVVDKPAGIMVADDFVCWVASGTKVTCMDKTLGAAAKVIGESPGGVADAAHDATSVYWLGADGTVMRAPRDGSAPAEKLASGQANPVGIAVDKVNVYWSTRGTEANKFRDGTVVMRPKP